ncbi:hypothetical protein F2P56_011126 [Juglans regia]|uniref:Sorting nexin C-terminal domain-containing protein n=1 Tax=Juglans regia TaxID=51240 RepID=A0A833XRR7_JUGRE|nr:hypothetical protein F2P56_011126 [Juglans regia]
MGAVRHHPHVDVIASPAARGPPSLPCSVHNPRAWRKAFWVAKQILQLGMGDAFDDWLIEKIQLLRKGSVIASGIRLKRCEILWPDGIFITKHRPAPPVNPSQNITLDRQRSGVSPPILTYEQQQEAVRRAKFVYELMIDNAPAAIIGLVGRKEYEQCAKDLYFFIQVILISEG